MPVKNYRGNAKKCPKMLISLFFREEIQERNSFGFFVYIFTPTPKVIYTLKQD